MSATRPPRPAEPLWENFPDALTTRVCWVGWRYELVRGRCTKIPLQPDATRASSTDMATWASFEHAQCIYFNRGYDGIGFVLSEADPFCGWDFDKCRDPATGEIEPAIDEYVRRLDSYTEVSPSNTGLRVLVRAALPPRHRRRGQLEVYDVARFLTLTGARLPYTSPIIQLRQEVVTKIHSEIFAARIVQEQAHGGRLAAKPVAASDAEIIERACKEPRFSALYRNGCSGGDWSAQDFQLCCALAFWTGRDPVRMERLFRSSALMREKWNRRDDYRASTIARAIASCSATYQPSVHTRCAPPPRFKYRSKWKHIVGLAGEYEETATSD